MSTPTFDQSISYIVSTSQVSDSSTLQLRSSLKIIEELKRDFFRVITTPCQGHILDQKKSEIVDKGLRFLNGQRQEEQWDILRRELHLAAVALLQHQPILYWSLDDTPRGEQHHVVAFLDQRVNRLSVEIPEEPEDPKKKGGRFPTVLHTLEMVVATIRLTNELNSLAGGEQTLPYPSIEFVVNDGPGPLAAKLEQVAQPTVMFVPLTIDSNHSNVLILQPNARGAYLSPADIAYGYYQVIQCDGELLSHLLRHTIVTRPKSPEKGLTDRDIQVGVLSKEVAEQDYDLSDLGRLREWSELSHREVALWKVTKTGGRTFYGFTLGNPSSNLPTKPLLSVGPDDEGYEGITEKKKPRAVVVGIGVIGLTNAILA